jgi:predicted  nucleic acid-binding Zn-ribbon protein
MPEFVTISALLNLHHTDRVLRDTKEGLENVTRDQKTAEEYLAKIDAEISRLEGELRGVRAKVAAEELETEVKRQHIDKMRSALNETKTNKDYSAILVQISAEKALVAEIENRTEIFMAKSQEITDAIKAQQEKRKSAADNLAALRASSAAKVDELNRRILELQTARVDAAGKVPAEALKQYERIAQRHPGSAMAPVEFEDDDMDNIACGGCFMGLNREDLNILRGRDEIRRCRSCGRILYFAKVPSSDTKTAAK